MTDTLKACLWMLGAVVSFSSMAVAGREVSFELDTFEIMMYRSLIGVVVVLVVASSLGTLKTVQRADMHIHFLRNICHFTGQNLWFFALTLIPLAQLFALEFTTPLWVVILSLLVLGEKVTKLRVLVAVAGFVGILMVTRPTAETLSIGTLTAAASAIFFAGSIVLTRKLTQTQSTTSILFWLVVLQAIFGLICAGLDGDIALPSSNALPFLVVIGLAGLCAHLCLTTAVGLAPATVVVPIDFIRLPLIGVVGWVLYSEPVDIWVIAGALVIFGANYANIWSETRKGAA
ncbi:DMT family transporter [Nereida sp. MMG025]|uniref:DMT family transporter n=1 Tax=Nereida sp. MMG025 TaxID=2909981 RepID=UPI001F417363|nr:DMT family transporter [Nereida sp. MMG025]MCF6443255.1 DMT family transporter [Nereida sp. MMG025]